MDPSLIDELNASLKQEAKAGKVKCAKNEVWDHPDLILLSWKFNEWDYYNTKLNLPIRSRGLFTKDNKIVVRGYDKFFNINETPATKWSDILQNTSGPYAVTLKENGCKIMIAGYQGKLIVTSKNSTGPRTGTGQKNHSFEALKWIRNRLKEVGKSEEELANELESRNLTGVGEFCDDTFEEHVLAYPPESAGLYFNGLNINGRTFKTLPPEEVNEFGARYGFLRTDFLMIEKVDELKAFLENCAETGSYNGRDIEGFVIRCKREDQDFFFKFKFEEPYLMYRTWREATKQILRNPESTPKYTKHAASTKEYLKFVCPYVARHPEFKHKVLNEGKGIIELREKFLEYSSMDPEMLLKLQLDEPRSVKYALIPVATLGCGKTTVAVALCKLFGWAHVQNDDVTKKTGKFTVLMERIERAFLEKDVVFIDRNNHQYRERQQIFESLDSIANVFNYEMRYVCLNFLPEGPTEKIWQITRERIEARGENHQTIRNMDAKMVTDIMKGFCGRFQMVVPAKEPDSQFQHIINVNCERGSSKNIKDIIASLNKKYDLKLSYTAKEFDEALSAALNHKAIIPEGPTPKKKLPGWSFFCLIVEKEVVLDLLEKHLADNAFWKQLSAGENGGSIKKEFHVTLAHKSGNQNSFKKFKSIFQSALTKSDKTGFVELGSSQRIVIKRLCWNARIMAAEVELLDDLKSSNAIPHITIGMCKGVAPVESNDMFKKEHSAISIDPVTVSAKVCAFR